MAWIQPISRLFTLSTRYGNLLAPLGDLVLRLYIARIFFNSGLVKIKSWESTLMLFKHEYHVPLLPSAMAAYLGTAAELALPVLIALGLGARLPAVALFIFNFVAAWSYPYLWTKAGACAMNAHIFWGFVIGVMCLHGPGRLSADYLLVKKDT